MALLVEGGKCKIQEKSTLWEVQYFYKSCDYTPLLKVP